MIWNKNLNQSFLIVQNIADVNGQKSPSSWSGNFCSVCYEKIIIKHIESKLNSNQKEKTRKSGSIEDRNIETYAENIWFLFQVHDTVISVELLYHLEICFLKKSLYSMLWKFLSNRMNGWVACDFTPVPTVFHHIRTMGVL